MLQDKELLTELRDDILVIALEMVSGGEDGCMMSWLHDET